MTEKWNPYDSWSSTKDNTQSYLGLEPSLLIKRLVKNGLVLEALRNGVVYTEISNLMSVITTKKNELRAKFETLNLKLIYKTEEARCFDKAAYEVKMYTFNGGFIHFLESDTSIANIEISVIREELATFFAGLIQEYKEPTPPACHVYSLVKRGDTLSLDSIGTIDRPLIKENYEENILVDMEHVIADIRSSDPCGKLTIIDGPPGTGKTSLIESLLSLDDINFVIVPSHQLISWGDPTLLTLLLQHKNINKKKLVFIIEDADDCLVNRDSLNSNKNAISTLLNMSDGILGSILDLRIIVTTNAKIKDFDPAIIRDSRLCRRIEIEEVSVERANKIYQRLTNSDKEPFVVSATLGEIYKLSKSPDQVKKLEQKKPTKVGFLQ